MFKKRGQKLLPRYIFFTRLTHSFLMGISIIFLSLLIGMLGYHYFEHISWIDSYVNAAMILSGMGPVDMMHTDASKIFAGSYALFSGIIFLIVMAVILAPVFHWVLHKFHLQEENKK